MLPVRSILCTKALSINNNSMNLIFDKLSSCKDIMLVSGVTANSQPIVSPLHVISNTKFPTRSISSDHSILGDIGYSFVISNHLLGHGSYGDVFLATDENGKEVAVKCCSISDNGIPNILEASIMGSLSHPYLNRSLRIQASDTKLYIIQDRAQTDLSQYTRRDKSNHTPSPSELQHWCFSITQAVSALHKENIIHADIKANNVLLYSDGSIRLTDFTLATKQWLPSEQFTHNVCTSTHRPLECLLRRPWNTSLDIWSLACTFYEIAYGELLFPYQGSLEPSLKPSDKILAKSRLRNRSINSIIDWGSKSPSQQSSFNLISTPPFPIDFLPFVLSPYFSHPSMLLFNDLLLSMLIVNPDYRPSIDQVSNHPFFSGLYPPKYLSIRRPINKISSQESARVARYIHRYTNNSTVQLLAMNMYCRCNDLHTTTEHIRSAVCTWIASKIVIGYNPKIDIPINQILAGERDICHNLLFRLHNL